MDFGINVEGFLFVFCSNICRMQSRLVRNTLKENVIMQRLKNQNSNVGSNVGIPVSMVGSKVGSPTPPVGDGVGHGLIVGSPDVGSGVGIVGSGVGGVHSDEYGSPSIHVHSSAV